MTEKQEDVAYIESLVSDQGNGISYCSVCKHSFDIGDIRKAEFHSKDGKLKCPKCNRKLQFGGIYIGGGGSDF